MWPSGYWVVEPKARASVWCAVMMLLALSMFSNWQAASRWLLSALYLQRDAAVVSTASVQKRAANEFGIHPRPREKNHLLAVTTLNTVRERWDAMWSTDVSAADANVAHLRDATVLIARAERGDLEAAADLIGAATWCLTGGPLVNVSQLIGNERRACFEYFGDALTTRQQLERASFTWVMQLAAAGLDDATLYASALIRGNGPDLLGGVDANAETREAQRELLLGQLQTLAERGSADAASELHGHWSGTSAFHLHDVQRAHYYAALTEQLDPSRSIAFITP
jgi:hypothetical protein